jgi:lactate permease
MWPQNYTPVADSLWASSLIAALPVFALLYLLGLKRKPAWVASLAGLATAAVVALFAYQMPAGTMLGAIGYGAAFGLFPIGWVVFCAILLYRVTVETGKFEILKDSIGSLTSDRRLQALLIAFAFGASSKAPQGSARPSPSRPRCSPDWASLPITPPASACSPTPPPSLSDPSARRSLRSLP